MFQEFLVLFEDFCLNNHSLELQFPQLVRCHSKPPHSLFPPTHLYLHLRNDKRAACNHGVMDARGRLIITKEA